VLIVASYLAPKVKWGLIDRYLVLAEMEGIEAILVLNKVDLLNQSDNQSFQEEARSRRELYRSLGYQVFELQANSEKSTDEIKALGEVLKGKISLLSGHSGVGKSTIVNR